MKSIIALSLLLPLSSAAQPALKELKAAAGPDVVAAAAAAPAAQGVLATPTRPADVVVSGEVIGTKKANIPEPISEHSANWMIAVVRVTQVIKGNSIQPLREVEVYFPASQDVVWANAPKFQVGQVGVWSLKPKAMVGGHYTALSPSDFRLAPDPRAIPSGQPQATLPAAATEADLIRFKDQISATLMALDTVEGVGIGADAAGKPSLFIYFLTNKTNAKTVRQAALNLLTPDQASKLQTYEALGQARFVPTAKVEG